MSGTQHIRMIPRYEQPEAGSDSADFLAYAIRDAFKRSSMNDFSGAAIYATYLAEKHGKDSFDAADLTKILGIGLNAAYDLMKAEDFPSCSFGKKESKLVVTAYELALWMQCRRKDLWNVAAGR